jgi:hypothetical protein
MTHTMPKFAPLCTMLCLLATLVRADAGPAAAECFDELPGESGIADDTPGLVKITPVLVSSKGAKAYVATEYLGSANLQASVYLRRGALYCLAGDLGAAVAVKGSARARSEGLDGLVVESKSDSDRFYRTFKHKAGTYALTACEVKPEGGRKRACTGGEK